MASVQELSAALVKADAAGDTAGATTLANAIRNMQASGNASPTAAPAQSAAPAAQGYTTPPPSGADTTMQSYTDQTGTFHPPAIVIHATPRPAPTPSPAAAPPPATQSAAPASRSPMDYLVGGDGGPSLAGSTLSTLSHGVDAIPIVGPATRYATDNFLAQTLGRIEGQTPDQFIANANAARAKNDSANPVAAVAGDIAGTVAPFAVGGAVPAAAKVLGMDQAAPLLGRLAAATTSNAGISGTDAVVRGKTPAEVAADTLLGGAGGAASSLAPAAVSAAGKAVADRFSPVMRAFGNTDNAAQHVVAGAAANDINSGQRVMTGADEAGAAINGQPVINADRYGTNVRTLARTATNIDPTADAALKNLTHDRFLTQSTRARDFVTRIAGGNVDDLAAQGALSRGAKAVNDPAYQAAYGAPGAHAIWTSDIRDLFQSPDFVNAVRGAERTGANDAAISGRRAVRNPFSFQPDGSITLRTNPDGSKALPNLPFWDIVQRNLRTGSEKAIREGDKVLGNALKDMRTKLLGSLDGAVPEFQAARQGAAKFFGAEDALEAGRNFVAQKTGLPEARAAWAKFSPAEKKLFATGFASSLIDKIDAASDRVNVINNIFGSPAARAQVELALGNPAAAQLEQFARIEDIMQETKAAVQGGSTTTKQLIAAGVAGGSRAATGAGVAGLMTGWDPKSMASGAVLLGAGRAGARFLSRSVDQKVMVRVAQILSSSDKAEINKLVLNATLSPPLADAIKAIESGMGVLIKAGTDRALAAQ